MTTAISQLPILLERLGLSRLKLSSQGSKFFLDTLQEKNLVPLHWENQALINNPWFLQISLPLQHHFFRGPDPLLTHDIP